MRTQNYETSLHRAAAGILLGALLGAALVTGALLGSALLEHIGRPADFASAARDLWLGMLVFVVAFGCFGSGLVALAAPLWWLLHRLGRRGWIDAAALGFLLCFVVVTGPSAVRAVLGAEFLYSEADGGGATVIDGKLTRHGWNELLGRAALLSTASALVGVTVWRCAYRRSTPTAAPPPTQSAAIT